MVVLMSVAVVGALAELTAAAIGAWQRRRLLDAATTPGTRVLAASVRETTGALR
jgi:hypothetical protein